MGRPPLAPGEKKELFNCKLEPTLLARLKTISHRRSARGCQEFTMTKVVSNLIRNAVMPPPATPEQLVAYYKKYPNLRP